MLDPFEHSFLLSAQSISCSQSIVLLKCPSLILIEVDLNLIQEIALIELRYRMYTMHVTILFFC